MLELALRYGHGPVTLKQIAARQDISADYLEQIFRKLRESGLAKSRRGPRGGFELARPPDRITLWDIIEALEESVAPVRCVEEDECKRVECPRMGACASRLAWVELKRAIQLALTGKTLKGILEDVQEFCTNNRPAHPFDFVI